jgi:hypothetical protein
LPLTVLMIVALLLPAASLRAQVPAAPGTRIRVQHPCGVPDPPRACAVLVGTVLRPAGNGLLVEDEQGTIRGLDLLPGARLERSAGHRRHTLLGLGIGGLVGLGTGAVLVSRCTQGGRGEDDGLCNLAYFVTVPVGAGLGALVGTLIRTERWEMVSTP